jgi:hypothetical protein
MVPVIDLLLAIQFRNVSAIIPNGYETALIAAYLLGQSPR